MRTRWIVLIAVLGVVLAACSDDDAELSTESTIVTGGTNAPATTTTIDDGADDGASGTTSPPSTLAGQAVTDFTVVARFPNDNGEERYYVIPDGAYTDVDLENFVFDLLEADPDLYGAEIFDDADAAEAFQVEEADRSEEEMQLLERHHFVTLIGRDRIEFNGPFAEFPGGAIGS
jgi:hypothetical protein